MELSTIEKEEQERKIIVREYKNLLKAFNRSLSTANKKLIRTAFDMANEAHKDTRRKSGEPYILHPLAVARIAVEEIGLGPTSAICALLHDVVEDTEITLEDIQKEFGSNVMRVIDGLTKISGVFDVTSSEQAENFKKVIFTLADDVRVILLKISDRLHNMRTMDSMPRHKQQRIAYETTYLYAPLAHRLGLYAVKSELEDLALKYTERDVYKSIASKLSQNKKERSKYINDFIKPLQAKLDLTDLKCKVFGRPKSISSIYNKMKKQGVEFEEVYDLFAIRIVINSTPENEKSDCWRAYSIVTEEYFPNPSRLRDWISSPKSNGYESLHTTVMGPKGRWVEVQIRTERMDEIAEKGYAAHWKYKEGANAHESAIDDWMRKIRDTLKNNTSNTFDFLDDFKLNLYSKEIYVFTPKGELKMMPAGSVALDFAYEIHSAVGNACIGAKVNHKLVPISHKLNNGDQIEILTSKKQKPSEDWINIVITAKAKGKIRDALKEEKRIIAQTGRVLLEKKLKQLGLSVESVNVNELASYFKEATVLDFLYKVATKNFALVKLDEIPIVAGKFKYYKNTQQQTIKHENFEETVKHTLKKNAELVIFGDTNADLPYKMSPCCNPIPGDEIFGFLTINEGIKIHKVSCPNAKLLMANYSYRVIKTKWTEDRDVSFLTGLKITGFDKLGLVNNLTRIISNEENINMRSITMDTNDGIFTGNIKIYIQSTEHLENLIQKIKNIDGVESIERIDE